jgi:hypothetical protein
MSEEKKLVWPTPEQKLEMAQELVAQFEKMCASSGVHEDPEIWVLAMYASTDKGYRLSLLPEGFR